MLTNLVGTSLNSKLRKLLDSIKKDGISKTAVKVPRSMARAFCRNWSDQQSAQQYDYRPYNLNFKRNPISEAVLNITRAIRGRKFLPAIIVHGVTPRSGTGFISDLLGLHPDIHRHPKDIYEVPFLKHTDNLLRFRDHFFASYPLNKGKIDDNAFLALFGTSFIAHIYSFANPNKRVLLTYPGVQFLDYFFNLFPHENLVLLMRDGRDVVASAHKSFDWIPFSELCKNWNDSARVFLHFSNFYKNEQDRFLMVKYEDAHCDCESIVKEVCNHFGLDPSRYPYDRAKDLSVIGSSTFKETEKGIWVHKSKTKDFNPIGRWVNWTPQQKKTFKKIAGKTLIDAHYADDFSW